MNPTTGTTSTGSQTTGIAGSTTGITTGSSNTGGIPSNCSSHFNCTNLNGYFCSCTFSNTYVYCNGVSNNPIATLSCPSTLVCYPQGKKSFH